MSHSPILFESDDENTDCNNDETQDLTIDEPVVKRPPGYVKDEACVFNLRLILKGVPPPPNYTTPELDTNDLLSKYYENCKMLAFASEVMPMEIPMDSSLSTAIEGADSGISEGVREPLHEGANSITIERTEELGISMDSATTEDVRKLPHGDASSLTTERTEEPEISMDSATTEDVRKPPHGDASFLTTERTEEPEISMDSAATEDVRKLPHKDASSLTTERIEESEISVDSTTTVGVRKPPHADNHSLTADRIEESEVSIDSSTTEGVRKPPHADNHSLTIDRSEESEISGDSTTTEGERKLPQESDNSIATGGIGESEVSMDISPPASPCEESDSATFADVREPRLEDGNSVTTERDEELGSLVDAKDNKVKNLICYRDNWKKDVPFKKDYSTIAWPDISHITHFDIYYNLGSMSEELAALIDKYRERYIGFETGSSFIMRNPVLTGSAKKRARRRAWGGYSPGRRLSHLAQRRRTFSSANLSLYSTNSNGRAILPGSLNNNKSAVSKKIIMVDMKSKNSQKSKSTSRIKDLNRSSSKPNINQSKRALFQSPDQVMKNSGRKDRTSKTTPNKGRTSKRSLWPSSDKKNRRSAKKATPKKTVIEDSDEEIGSEEVINANGKRVSNSSDSCQARKRCQKSLNFSSDHNMSVNEENVSGQNAGSLVKQHRPQNSQQLSQLHKQKMVWAVASSLKQCGINNSHELFRPVGTVLFRKCRQVWLNILSTKKSDVKRSTSEQMFEIAIKYAPETIKKLKSITNPRVSLSTENFVNINKVTSEEKSKAGFSKVSDIFFNNVKNSQSSQEDPSSRTEEEKESKFCVKPSVAITDSNSNSLSHQSSEFSFKFVKDEKIAEISNSEYSNSNTDDSIEKNLRQIFSSCGPKPVKLGEVSSSPLDLPKIFDDDSQISQFNINSNSVTSRNPNLSIDKLSSNSAFNKPMEIEEPVDSSLRDLVENLKSQIESSFNENDSGFIESESTSTAKPSKSVVITTMKNEIQSPTTFTATVSKEFSSISEEKENKPLVLGDVSMVPILSTENSTFRFKKFGSLAENTEPFAEKESNDSNKSNVVTAAHFDETAMSSCDISVNES